MLKTPFMIAALMALLFSGSVLAQDNQEAVDSHTVIRAESRLVLVDAVVTDKKGGYVHDLTQKDFKVYEDNKEQNVTSFSVEAGAAPGENARKHYLVLFFDNSNAQPAQQVYARDAATKFIQANAGPNRLMAIAEFGGSLRMAQNFTDDADRLKQVVAGVKFASTGSAATAALGGGSRRMNAAFNDYSIRGVLGALRSMAKGLADVPGRKTLVFLSGGFPMPSDILPEVTATIDACNRANVAIYPIDIRGLVAPSIGAVGSLGWPRGLAQMAMLQASPLFPLAFQGRGGGVPTTGGGGAPPAGGGGGRIGSGGGNPGGGGGISGGRPTSPTTGTTGGGGRPTNPTNGGINNGRGGGPINNPNNPNNIYNPNNPNNPMNRMRNILPPIDNGVTGNQQVLYALANGTGGFVIVNTNDLLGGMEKIGKEQNEYYILGYAPAKEAEPGACHSLKVKVDHGYTLRARTGYCEAKGVDMLSGTPAERDLEARLSANAASTVSGAVMSTPFFYIAPNTARVNIALEIPAGAMTFAKDKGKFHSTTNIVGIAYMKDGSVGARFSDSVRLIFEDKKEVEAFSEKPYHYEKQFEVAPGTYTLKVVFSSAANQLGRLETPLTVEPWEPANFALSALALSTSVHPARDIAGGIDAELIDNRTPLVINGVQVVPTGAMHFKKADKNYVYAEMYEPALTKPDIKEADVPAIGVRMEILDPTDSKVKKDFGLTRLPVPPLTGNPAVPMGLVFMAPELAPGPYKLRVTALDQAGHEYARVADIQLE